MKKSLTAKRLLCQLLMKSLQQIVLLIVAAQLAMAAPLAGQNLLDKRVTLSLNRTSLGTALQQLEKTAEIKFSYNSRMLPLKFTVSVNAQNEPLAAVLDKLLLPNKISYKQVSNRIVLRNQPETINAVEPAVEPNAEKFATVVEDRSLVGKVSSDKGEGLPGVNIVIKGSQRGAVTNADGSYSLLVPDGPQTVVFSSVGYISQEIVVAPDRTALDVSLKVDEKALEEVVVVGYGTQKKVNLTGSVSTVNVDNMQSRQVSNSLAALQGQVTGLRISQGTGMPGRESVSLQLRGASSWGTNTSPLVLVDGVVGSLDVLPMSDIESISVLKDAASASIYGARAANGVILVTTKQGKKGKPALTYNMSLRTQSPTGVPNQIWNSGQYMELFNRAVARNAVSAVPFPQALIDKYKNPNRDKNQFPDYNWADAVWQSAPMQEHNVGVNGGSDAFKYNISAGIIDQKGVLMGHKYKRFNGLANLSTTINKYITVGTNVSYMKGNSVSPYYENQNFVLMTMTQSPLVKPYLPDGSGRYTDKAVPTGVGGTQNNRNPFWIANETYRDYEDWQANVQGWLDVNFLQTEKMGLKWSSKYASRFAEQFRNIYHYGADAYYYLPENEYTAGGANVYQKGTPFGPEALGVNQGNFRTLLNTFYSSLNWNWNPERQDISFMVGYSQEEQKYRWLGGTRNVFPVKNMYELDGMGPLNQTTTGGLTEWAFQSIFGRATYALASKYLLEANFRYDGTSRIYKDSRWGFFPSASAAWRISEEAFVRDGANWIDNLKIRASYGLLGNANISEYKVGNTNLGEYPWQDTYVSTTYAFNEALMQGVQQTAFRNRGLRWEKTTVADIGLDFNLKSDRIYGTIDWYNKLTTGILAGAIIPASAGMSAPVINYGTLRNYGIEFELGHKGKFGSVEYGLNGQLSINRNKVVKFPAPAYSDRIIQEGLPYRDYYLYEYTGLFKSEEELKAVVTPGNPQLGDIKFKDQNNDGKIDGDDRIRVKGAYPGFIYSFGGNVRWNNFDLALFFQGVQGQKVRTYFFGEDPFSQGSSPHPKFLDAYDPVTNPDSEVPAIYGWGYAPMTGGTAQNSTYFLKDASYLRLKNLQIGYTIPTSITKKVGISHLKVFLTGDNILTFTKYPDLDPERAGDGWHAQYPQLKVYSVGLNLRF
ncbi:TonB-linked outer membrane protein, SusC/RagA family [Dyadobacter soli]|uniref:TonB-linked outer membrane protein, SusC/RagA family n=1 Tax=Dyadobacter soli TaxID=659014 RepID=A0A1G7G9C6_9BACT|nr:TonB-dependent receptor [Dyadobacter soli]SDE84748.1 TonB-linked outer membrane protein, SusC/RagA family [Dyadobacter soli]